MRNRVVVIGLGEIGRPLLELIEEAGMTAAGIDVDTADLPTRGTVGVMHVCIPFEIDDFVGEVARYAGQLEPELIVVNSTVSVGTTRAIHERTGVPAANSPVRGKHVRMHDDLLHYDKFVGGVDADAGAAASAHFEALGMRTRVLASAETSELAKLSETTYFGVLVAWAQEVERYCDQFGLDYDEVVSFYEEIGYLPRVKYFPGVIGGHCLMPNIEILLSQVDSRFLDALKASNAAKLEREGSAVGIDQ
jgi:UDP-N-acetyl-D-mannosaminuronate dehydrogenase